MLLDRCKILEVVFDPLDLLHAQILVHHFTAAKADRDLGPIPGLQEAAQIAQLDLVVALVRAWAKFDLLDLNLFLTTALGLTLLALVELVFAEVHDPANRRFRGRHDLDQVEFRHFGNAQGLCDRNDSDLTSVGSDQAHLGCVDLVVQPRLFVLRDIRNLLTKNNEKARALWPSRPRHDRLSTGLCSGLGAASGDFCAEPFGKGLQGH